MFKDDNEKLILKLPFGFRDIFPVEAQERKEIEDSIRAEFFSWGYGEVKTPIVEFTKNISAGVGKDWKDKLISLFDIDGNLISLRTDMTIPIARLAGMRIRKDKLPVRFSYFANSFRQSAVQKGQKRVLSQAGLEFIGSDMLAADIEVLTILVNILKKLGIKDFKIALGHTKFIDGICKWFDLDIEETGFIHENMISKNFVALREFLEKKDKGKTGVFMDLLKPIKDFRVVTDDMSMIREKYVQESMEYTLKVYRLLESLGFNDYFIIDLGTIRNFGYYSGLLFEIYCPKVTELLGSGGRYDGLIKKFGLDVCATGFALDMDLLHKSIEDLTSGSLLQRNRIILCGKIGSIVDLIKFSARLRAKGNIVELFFEDPERAVLKEDQKTDFIYNVDFDTGLVSIIDMQTGSHLVKELTVF